MLELLKKLNTLSEIAQKYEIRSTIISKWETEFLEKASIVFETEKEKTKELFDPEELFKEVGKMKVEIVISIVIFHSSSKKRFNRIKATSAPILTVQTNISESLMLVSDFNVFL